METKFVSKLRFREDTAANWTIVNPVLDSSEPGRETDTGAYKIGDGVTPWRELPYQATDTAVIPDVSADGKLYARTRTANGELGIWKEIINDTRRNFNDLLQIPYDAPLNMGYKLTLPDGTKKTVYGIKKFFGIDALPSTKVTEKVLDGVYSIVQVGGTFEVDADETYLIPTNTDTFRSDVTLNAATHTVYVTTQSVEQRNNAKIDIWLMYTKVEDSSGDDDYQGSIGGGDSGSTPEIPSTPGPSLDFEATLKERGYCTVTYINGENTTTTIQKIGSLVNIDRAIITGGSGFMGWSTTEDGSHIIFKVEDTVTLYAIYTPDYCTQPVHIAHILQSGILTPSEWANQSEFYGSAEKQIWGYFDGAYKNSRTYDINIVGYTTDDTTIIPAPALDANVNFYYYPIFEYNGDIISSAELNNYILEATFGPNYSLSLLAYSLNGTDIDITLSNLSDYWTDINNVRYTPAYLVHLPDTVEFDPNMYNDINTNPLDHIYYIVYECWDMSTGAMSLANATTLAQTVFNDNIHYIMGDGSGGYTTFDNLYAYEAGLSAHGYYWNFVGWTDRVSSVNTMSIDNLRTQRVTEVYAVYSDGTGSLYSVEELNVGPATYINNIHTFETTLYNYPYTLLHRFAPNFQYNNEDFLFIGWSPVPDSTQWHDFEMMGIPTNVYPIMQSNQSGIYYSFNEMQAILSSGSVEPTITIYVHNTYGVFEYNVTRADLDAVIDWSTYVPVGYENAGWSLQDHSTPVEDCTMMVSGVANSIHNYIANNRDSISDGQHFYFVYKNSATNLYCSAPLNFITIHLHTPSGNIPYTMVSGNLGPAVDASWTCPDECTFIGWALESCDNSDVCPVIVTDDIVMYIMTNTFTGDIHFYYIYQTPEGTYSSQERMTVTVNVWYQYLADEYGYNTMGYQGVAPTEWTSTTTYNDLQVNMPSQIEHPRLGTITFVGWSPYGEPSCSIEQPHLIDIASTVGGPVYNYMTIYAVYRVESQNCYILSNFNLNTCDFGNLYGSPLMTIQKSGGATIFSEQYTYYHIQNNFQDILTQWILFDAVGNSWTAVGLSTSPSTTDLVDINTIDPHVYNTLYVVYYNDTYGTVTNEYLYNINIGFIQDNGNNQHTVETFHDGLGFTVDDTSILLPRYFPDFDANYHIVGYYTDIECTQVCDETTPITRALTAIYIKIAPEDNWTPVCQYYLADNPDFSNFTMGQFETILLPFRTEDGGQYNQLRVGIGASPTITYGTADGMYAEVYNSHTGGWSYNWAQRISFEVELPAGIAAHDWLIANSKREL